MRISLILAVLASPAAAQSPLGAEAFDAYTRGKTLEYALGGAVYGAEQYLPGRRVRWTFFDGRCLDGRWYEDGELICFLYETQPGDPQCWTFSLDEDGLSAEFDGEGDPIYETRAREGDLYCEPEVGV